MARLRTSGFELADILETRSTSDEPQRGGTGTANTIVGTTHVRSGDNAGKCTAQSAGITSFWGVDITLAASRRYWARCHYYITLAPTVTCRILDWGNLEIQYVTGTGKLRLLNNGVQVDVDSTLSVPIGEFFKLEVEVLNNGANTQWTEVEVRLNDAVIWNLAGLTITNGGSLLVGWVTNPNAAAPAVEVWLDDIAINDDTGADQNSWCGDGKVVALMPASDSNRGAWTGGAGGTTNLFEALNNRPPVGVAAASATDASQVEHPGTSLPNNIDINLETYASKGIKAADTIVLVVEIVSVAENVTTGTKTLSVQMVSNPAIAADAAVSVGALAAGTHPSGWTLHKGPTSYAPAVTVGTAPVARATLATASGTTDIGMESMYLTVEYVPKASLPPQVVSYLS